MLSPSTSSKGTVSWRAGAFSSMQRSKTYVTKTNYANFSFIHNFICYYYFKYSSNTI